MNKDNTTSQPAGENLSGVHRLFNNPTMRQGLLLLRFPLALAVIILLALRIKPEFFWPALIVTAVGEFIQVWCFSALKKKKILAVRGPYVLVRNPMYLGRYLIILGGLLLLGNVWVMVAYTVLYYFYMVNRVRREEAVLIKIFGDSYEDYCRRVNRFLPTFRGVDWKSLPYFRRELFLRNNAHWNLLGTILCYAFFYYMTFCR